MVHYQVPLGLFNWKFRKWYKPCNSMISHTKNEGIWVFNLPTPVSHEWGLLTQNVNFSSVLTCHTGAQRGLWRPKKLQRVVGVIWWRLSQSAWKQWWLRMSVGHWHYLQCYNLLSLPAWYITLSYFHHLNDSVSATKSKLKNPNKYSVSASSCPLVNKSLELGFLRKEEAWVWL